MLQYMPIAKYFKNLNGDRVPCSCCGKKIKKGYFTLGVSVGEDCFDTIREIFKRNIEEGSSQAKFFNIQQMHFDWIKSR
jgi:hypothetical protein